MVVVGRDALKAFLKGRIAQNASMTVPKVLVKGVFPKQYLPYKNTVIRTMESDEKDMVREFILKNFYTNAPVPSALKLRETWPKHKYLSDELDLMLSSEVNQLVFDCSDTLVGATINTAWPVDHSYRFFDADPVLWLNLAAEIANEETRDPLYATVIWRDFHFQLIYHIVQGIAQTRKVKHIWYGGMGYTIPKYRDLGALPFILKATNDWLVANNCIYTFMGTFPGFLQKMQKLVPGIFDCLHDIPYDDLIFRRTICEENVFSVLKGGMIMMASSRYN